VWYRTIQPAERFRVLNTSGAFRRLRVPLILDFGNEIRRIFTGRFLLSYSCSVVIREIQFSVAGFRRKEK
jgi:hypothetical protein